VAFRFFRQKLVEKYGAAGAKERIFATTDKARGALKALADAEGWETFVVPDDVGGRYSVLTAVGLLPIAVAGIDIDALMAGAGEMMDVCAQPGCGVNPAWRYAAVRYQLYRTGKTVEILGCYDPAFRFMAEWWKQLYGESEGKEGKGLFPASVEFTADLHSMGQYIQQGQRLMFETIVRFGPSDRQLLVPREEQDGDGLNFLAGKSMDFIRDRATEGTLLAHTEGGVPNVIVDAEGRNARSLGQLIYFFEYACGLSGYLLDVNPFDQPGVEAYKKNMFALLGKPGYEARRAELEAKLGE
jgi:glucose-6-phosphate isomerase